jgi:hypothetical protein
LMVEPMCRRLVVKQCVLIAVLKINFLKMLGKHNYFMKMSINST